MRWLTPSFIFGWLMIVPQVHAENWAHWRGPTGNGVSTDAKPPVKWSSSQNVKWKIAIPGRGMSSPVIWNDRVFVSGSAPVTGENPIAMTTHEFKIYCFDRKTGQEIWSKIATTSKPHERTHETNGFASASPCTDGERVYVHFGSRGLYCYTLDGDPVWKRDDLGKMATLNGFGEGSSPTLADDKIIVPWDHTGPSSLHALNKRTGAPVWRIDRDEPSCWATPLVVEHSGKKQIVMNGQNFARSYDLDTGLELWRCGGQARRPVASPVAANGLIYVCSGHQGSFMGAFHPDGQGDIKGTDKVAWILDHDCPDIPSPLLSSGRLYFHKAKSGQLSCIDAATGKPHYLSQRIDGVDKPYSSPIAAGGHVYLTGTNGITTVIKDSEKLTVVASNDVGETVSATLAPVDNELFLRGEKHLFCIAEGTSRE